MIKVDRGIPIPGRGARYPWSAMKVGDSFAVPEDEAGGMRNAARWDSQQTGRTYTTRKRVEDGRAVVRVWRTG